MMCYSGNPKEDHESTGVCVEKASRIGGRIKKKMDVYRTWEDPTGIEMGDANRRPTDFAHCGWSMHYKFGRQAILNKTS